MAVQSGQRDLPVAAAAPGVSARRRLMVATLVGVVAAAPVALLTAWQVVPLAGWDVAAGLFVLTVWRHILRLDPERTARLAVREDPTRAAADALLLVAAVVSLAVAAVLVRASQAHGGREVLQVGVGVGSVLVSWTVVHTVFTLRYARLYYTGADGGVDFNTDAKPSYLDFAYLAFTVGMTFQVSDTDLQTRRMRAAVLQHALLSYLFGVVIIAMTINLVVGLAH